MLKDKFSIEIGELCKLISKYRKGIMGFSILLVVFFHMRMSLPIPFNMIKARSYGAVDVLLFLSGFGIFYSIEKNESIDSFKNLSNYYLRRFKRIYPTYVFILIIYYLININQFTAGPNISEALFSFLGNLLLFGYIAKIKLRFNWFIFAIILFYLFSPLFFYLIKNKRILLIPLSIIFVALNIFCLKTNKLMLASRIFIYILGMIFAYLGEYHEQLKINIPLLFIFFIIGSYISVCPYITSSIRYNYGLYWYPFIIIVPGAIYLLANIAELLSNIRVGKGINNSFNYLGNITLEIYLIEVAFHERISILLNNYLTNIYICEITTLVIIVLIAILLKYTMDLLIKKSKKDAKNNNIF